ncbi:MAG: prohibitin family protein [Saprospiraceae bacterium]|nr:prohibitin family protein [Saprospiraceae bacterium]
MPSMNLIKYGVYAFIAFILFSVLSSTTFLTIEPGRAGILFKRFSGGIDKTSIYQPGFHVIAPWNKMFIYETRILEGVEKMEVLSKNGLTIVVELSYRFMPQLERLGYLHETVGPEYAQRIIIPEIRSATREVIGKYLPEELYSTKRESIQTEIFDRTSESIGKKDLILDAILIREVALPAKLKEAIEQKLGEEQMAFQYEFKLDRERKEAERKIIEAQAKAESNRILNASLTDKILRDKGIEATLTLANSPNSKIVIIGESKGGLPLILGGD